MGGLGLVFNILRKKVNAYTIVEPIVAVIIFLICFGLATTVMFEYVRPKNNKNMQRVLFLVDSLRSNNLLNCNMLERFYFETYYFKIECIENEHKYSIINIKSYYENGQIINSQSFLLPN